MWVFYLRSKVTTSTHNHTQMRCAIQWVCAFLWSRHIFKPEDGSIWGTAELRPWLYLRGTVGMIGLYVLCPATSVPKAHASGCAVCLSPWTGGDDATPSTSLTRTPQPHHRLLEMEPASTSGSGIAIAHARVLTSVLTCVQCDDVVMARRHDVMYTMAGVPFTMQSQNCPLVMQL